MTPAEIAALPDALTTEQVAPFYGVTVETMWALARRGRAPIEPLRLGRALRWPTRKVLESLGIAEDGP